MIPGILRGHRHIAAPTPPVVSAVPSAVARPPMLPGLRVVIEGYPVDVDALEVTNRVNAGYEQFRAVTSHEALSGLPWTAGLGSTVTVYDDTDQVAWEGRLSAAPTVEPDQTVRLTAQGHVYQAVKSVRRIPAKAIAPEAWVVANTSPLDFPQTAGAQPEIIYSKSSGVLVNNRFSLTYSAATDVSVAFYAPGAEIRRLTFTGFTGHTTATVKVWGAVGGRYASKVLLYNLSDTLLTGNLDIPAQDFDTIVINLVYAVNTSGELTVTNPTIWTSTGFTGALYSHDLARSIGALLDWDTSTIGDVGEVGWPSFDWGAEVSGALSEAAAPDDFRWRVLEDRGAGPVLEFGDWERTWEVSASEGARWALDPLEPYTKVVVQYLDAMGKARAVEATEDPDPYLGRITNELRAVAGGLESVDEPSGLPQVMADNLLEWATGARWRGSISTAAVHEEGTGISSLSQVRAGDLVRITDFSPTDGSITLRIAEVQLNAQGITLGIEAPAISAGSIAASAGGATPGSFHQTSGEDYIPPGAPGSTTPIATGGPIDTLPDLPPGPWGKFPPKF